MSEVDPAERSSLVENDESSAEVRMYNRDGMVDEDVENDVGRMVVDAIDFLSGWLKWQSSSRRITSYRNVSYHIVLYQNQTVAMGIMECYYNLT